MHDINPQHAFEHAISAGALSAYSAERHYAGDWMYMGSQIDPETGFEVDLFKHRDTRRYICVPRTGYVVICQPATP